MFKYLLAIHFKKFIMKIQVLTILFIFFHQVEGVNKEIDMFDPDRPVHSGLTLVCRNDTKNCPKSVRRCEVCKRQFMDSDLVIVKTAGEREFVDAKGIRVQQHGNIYLHYLTACLSKFDQSFQFWKIHIAKDTQRNLSKESLQKLVAKVCKLV